MKKVKSLYGFFILVLMVMAIALYGLHLKQSKQLISGLKKEINALKTDRTELHTLLEDANLSLLYALQATGATLPDTICERIAAGDLVRRMRQDICMACYEPMLRDLCEYVRQDSFPHLFILCSYTYDHSFGYDVSLFKDTKAEKMNVLSLSLNPVDELGMPFFFRVSPQGEMKDVFIIQKKNTRLFHEYLDWVAERQK